MKYGRYLLVAFLLLLSSAFLYLRDESGVPLRRPLAEFPQEFAGWRVAGEEVFPEDILAVLRPTDYLSRTYVDRDGSRVRLYIGYHGGGEASGEIHSPKQCLPGSGWFELSSEPTRLTFDGQAIALVRAVYQKGEQRELLFYWYQVRERTIDNEYLLKLTQAASSLLDGRRDSAFIRISVPGGEEDAALAETVALRFTREAFPVIRLFLPE